MSPRSYFPHGSAVFLTGSSSGHVIALDQSEARKSAKRAEFTTEKYSTTVVNNKISSSILFNYKLTMLFSTEKFSGAKEFVKFLIIII